MCPSVPAWHVDHVSADDDKRLRQIMIRRERDTGEQPTKSGTIRRAVRDLWEKEVGEE